MQMKTKTTVSHNSNEDIPSEMKEKRLKCMISKCDKKENRHAHSKQSYRSSDNKENSANDCKEVAKNGAENSISAKSVHEFHSTNGIILKEMQVVLRKHDEIFEFCNNIKKFGRISKSLKFSCNKEGVRIEEEKESSVAANILETPENVQSKGKFSTSVTMKKITLKRNLSIIELKSCVPSEIALGDDGNARKVPNETSKGSKRKREKPSASEEGSKAKSRKKEKEPVKNSKNSDVSAIDFSNNSKSHSGSSWNFKISSWNINGVRAWLEKDGASYLQHEQPDIFCVQETKCSEEKLPAEVKKVEGYHTFWLSADKEGYSGVGLLSKEKPMKVDYGIGIEEHDTEGRVITAEYDQFYLVSAYVPNAGRGLVRLDYRMKWDKDFRIYLKKLDAKKPVILCGDLNVAHNENDLANPKTNKKNAGFTKEEREGFSSLLEEGFIDSFRHLYPDETGAYTFWTYMFNARSKNVGWRLDYFVVSERFSEENLCDSVIRKDVLGSDHCPVTLFLSL